MTNIWQRRWFILGAAVIVAVLAFMLAPQDSYAASYKKPTEIKTDKAYKVNLNGGKTKETVEVATSKVFHSSDEYDFTIKYVVKVNGKNVKTLNSERGGDGKWSFYYADFNSKDKYKELLMQKNPQDVSTPKIYIYRYKGQKLSSVTATFKIPEVGTYDSKHTYKKSKYIPGWAANKTGWTAGIRIYKGGIFKTKVWTASGSSAACKWFKFKMSTGGKITRA